MADFVENCEVLFVHHFQGTNFFGVNLPGKIHLPVSTLSNLRQCLEVAIPDPRSLLP